MPQVSCQCTNTRVPHNPKGCRKGNLFFLIQLSAFLHRRGRHAQLGAACGLCSSHAEPAKGCRLTRPLGRCSVSPSLRGAAPVAADPVGAPAKLTAAEPGERRGGVAPAPAPPPA